MTSLSYVICGRQDAPISRKAMNGLPKGLRACAGCVEAVKGSL